MADQRSKDEELRQRLLDQFEGRARREYTEGRIGDDDEGVLAYAVAADRENGIVRISFGKPVSWVGMGPKDAVLLAESIIARAREVATEPLTVNLGKVTKSAR